MRIIKNAANFITVSRVCFAILMVVVPPFSGLFWFGYLGGGISDMCDGWIARKLNQQSELGAKLDSIADGAFAIAIAITVVREIKIPIWIWNWILVIAIIRIVSYGVGFYKFHTFSSLHTYMNKITGFIIFIIPMLYIIIGKNTTLSLACVIATLSAVEELIITVRTEKFNRNVRGMWCIWEKL